MNDFRLTKLGVYRVIKKEAGICSCGVAAMAGGFWA